MQTRAGQLARIGVLSVCLVATSHDDRDAVVLAQPANATRNGVVTGELVIEPPTLINLGFEWLIHGDDNRNAAVQVSYRKRGEAAWSSALPLLRLQRERVFVGPQFDVVAPNMFAGSILDLELDTDYEARFMMTDPDGLIGEATRILTVRTRAEPAPREDDRAGGFALLAACLAWTNDVSCGIMRRQRF